MSGTFEEALHAAGLRPRDVIPDGLWHRCPTIDKPKKKNGVYKLDVCGTKGWYRNWGDPVLGVAFWKQDGPARTLRRVDEAKIAAARERDRRNRIEGIRKARALWAAGTPMRELHPYLRDKGLQPRGCAQLRTWRGWLLIPVMVDNSLLNVQRIGADGKKLFVKHAPVKGGCYVLGRPDAAVTAFCEGFATGLAVYQSVRHCRVVVAYDAGNLFPVVERFKPTGSVVLVADNDHGTLARRGFNPGLQAARNAAELCDAGVTWPEGIEGTDFADALYEWGEGAAGRIERQVLAAARFVFRECAL